MYIGNGSVDDRFSDEDDRYNNTRIRDLGDAHLTMDGASIVTMYMHMYTNDVHEMCRYHNIAVAVNHCTTHSHSLNKILSNWQDFENKLKTLIHSYITYSNFIKIS